MAEFEYLSTPIKRIHYDEYAGKQSIKENNDRKDQDNAADVHCGEDENVDNVAPLLGDCVYSDDELANWGHQDQEDQMNMEISTDKIVPLKKQLKSFNFKKRNSAISNQNLFNQDKKVIESKEALTQFSYVNRKW